MRTVLINSKNTLFKEYLSSLIGKIENVVSVDSCSDIKCMEAKLKEKNYDFVFIDLFSRTYEDEMLTMLHSYCDVSDVVMFTTKENNLLNYFNYKYGIKHYIFSDGDVDDILDSINSLLLGIEGSNDKSVSNVLTSRECEILKHIAEGKTSKEIADELCISKNTVDTHRNKMLQKLNLANSASLVHYAFKSGMV